MLNNRQAYLQAYYQKRKAELNARKRELRQKARKQVETLAVETNQKMSQLNPKLIRLIHRYQTQTNYSCPPSCSTNYCNNCWYFHDNQLINYKTHLNSPTIFEKNHA